MVLLPTISQLVTLPLPNPGLCTSWAFRTVHSNASSFLGVKNIAVFEHGINVAIVKRDS